MASRLAKSRKPGFERDRSEDVMRTLHRDDPAPPGPTRQPVAVLPDPPPTSSAAPVVAHDSHVWGLADEWLALGEKTLGRKLTIKRATFADRLQREIVTRKWMREALRGRAASATFPWEHGATWLNDVLSWATQEFWDTRSLGNREFWGRSHLDYFEEFDDLLVRSRDHWRIQRLRERGERVKSSAFVRDLHPVIRARAAYREAAWLHDAIAEIGESVPESLTGTIPKPDSSIAIADPEIRADEEETL